MLARSRILIAFVLSVLGFTFPSDALSQDRTAASQESDTATPSEPENFSWLWLQDLHRLALSSLATRQIVTASVEWPDRIDGKRVSAIELNVYNSLDRNQPIITFRESSKLSNGEAFFEFLPPASDRQYLARANYLSASGYRLGQTAFHPITTTHVKLAYLEQYQAQREDAANEAIALPGLTPTASGTITIAEENQETARFVVARLIERPLAGGTTIDLLDEQRLPIDPQAPTVEYALFAPLKPSQDRDWAIQVWATDAGGRKIQAQRRPSPWVGPDEDYDIRLDAIRQGVDDPSRAFDHAFMAQTAITGDVIFGPAIGMPSQARLRITLRGPGPYGRDRDIVNQTLLITDFPQQVRFQMSAPSTAFDPYIPAPRLSAELVDETGYVHALSAQVIATEMGNRIPLYPANR